MILIWSQPTEESPCISQEHGTELSCPSWAIVPKEPIIGVVFTQSTDVFQYISMVSLGQFHSLRRRISLDRENLFTDDYIDLSLILVILMPFGTWENFFQEARYGYFASSVLGSVCCALTMGQRNMSMNTPVIGNGVLEEPTGMFSRSRDCSFSIQNGISIPYEPTVFLFLLYACSLFTRSGLSQAHELQSLKR